MASASLVFFRSGSKWHLLGIAFFLALATFVPTFYLGDAGFDVLVGDALSGNDADVIARQLVLHAGVTIPFAAAMGIAMMTSELYATSMSWSLPDLGRKMLFGHVVVVIALVALVAGFATQRVSGWTALYAGAMVPFWYAIGACGLLLVFRRYYWMLVTVPMLLVVFRPQWYAAMLVPSAAASVIAISALLVGVALLVVRHRASWMRLSLARQFPRSALDILPAVGQRTASAELAFRPPSARHSLLSWIDAAISEQGPTREGWLKRQLLFWSLFSVFLYVAGASLGIAGMSLAQGRLQLSNGSVYPLSRTQRATLRYSCSLIETAILVVAIGASYTVLELLGVSRSLFIEPTTHMNWRVELAALAALAPIGQLGRLMKPRPLDRFTPGWLLAAVPLMMGTGLLPNVFRRVLGPDATLLAIGWLGLILVVGQVLFYGVVRWANARRDL
ncbi:MAG: hypothetical protein IT353_23365 [Gemmatimonadaceae bacterium]|nr:hypothetical protein [Gemmatimonadaceae bacterium]